MKYRRLGRTELQVSVMALGTVELGVDYGIQAPGHFGRPSEEVAEALLDGALAAGINLLDTARGYGESEALLGRLLKRRHKSIVLATKANAHLPDGTVPFGAALYDHLVAQLETSLYLLQADYVDIWQIHNVDNQVLAQSRVLGEIFAEMQQAGKIRASGGSFYGATLPVKALEKDIFDILQVTYSIFDQRIKAQVLPLAQQRDVGIMVRSVLLKGALTERADYLPIHLQPLREQSFAFRQFVHEEMSDCTPAQIALAFAMANPQIHCALVGMRTVDELLSNLRATEIKLPSSILTRLQEFCIEDEELLNPATWGIP